MKTLQETKAAIEILKRDIENAEKERAKISEQILDLQEVREQMMRVQTKRKELLDDLLAVAIVQAERA